MVINWLNSVAGNNTSLSGNHSALYAFFEQKVDGTTLSALLASGASASMVTTADVGSAFLK